MIAIMENPRIKYFLIEIQIVNNKAKESWLQAEEPQISWNPIIASDYTIHNPARS